MDAASHSQRMPPAAPESEQGPPRPQRRGRVVHSSDLWIVLAVAVVVILFLSNMIWPLAEMLYGPAAFVVAAVMIVEFLILKARDRSRFYRLELQLMRNRRREDIRLLRETRDALAESLRSLRQARQRLEEDGSSAEETKAVLDSLEEQVQRIHDDIYRR
jgi:ABC-type multidrug transport system fused ATPase/permease subunit